MSEVKICSVLLRVGGYQSLLTHSQENYTWYFALDTQKGQRQASCFRGLCCAIESSQRSYIDDSGSEGLSKILSTTDCSNKVELRSV